MKKLTLLLTLCATLSFARFEAIPAESCEAYNNMKHTKNTHHVILDTHKKYLVLKHHKKQNLILIQGETPAQRWVDDSCFSTKKQNRNPDNVKPAKSKILNIEDELTKASRNMSQNRVTKNAYTRPKLQQNLLALSWHNAFCETHRYKKECKVSLLSKLRTPYSSRHFILHGLWPQPRSNLYCGVNSKQVGMDKYKQWNRLPSLGLSQQTKIELKKIMPGFSSNLHKHEWIKHGTCYGTDEEQYYSDAIELTKQLNSSKVGQFFTNNIGKVVTIKRVRQLFESSFGKGAGEHVELKCKNGLIGELWIHLGSGKPDLETLLKKGKRVRSRCQKGRIDIAGF